MAHRYRHHRARPSHIAQVLGWVGYRGVVSASVLTALLVATTHPTAMIWVPVWVLLTALLAMLDMWQTLPSWFAWFRGRPPQRQRSPND